MLALAIVLATSPGQRPHADAPAARLAPHPRIDAASTAPARPPGIERLARIDPPTPAPIPDDTDLLLVEPAGRLRRDRLDLALRQLGYATLPAAPGIEAVRVRVPAGVAPGTLAARLAASGLAAAIEPDLRVSASRLPDDPLLYAQRPYLDAVRAGEGWERGTGRGTVTIAVVDTGVDTAHPDLIDRIVRRASDRFDGLDEDANGCADDANGCSFVSPAAADPSCDYPFPGPRGGAEDDEGHGTFVAGIAAAAGGNGTGTTGVAWDARILPVKVLDCTATGRISDAAAGIRYAARSGARIIIVAFGSPSDSRLLRDAVAEAVDIYGALIVASAGNEGSTARVQFPAAYPGVLAVGGAGTPRLDGTVDYAQAAPFSNAGPELALLAPAARIVAPLPYPSCGQRGWVCIEGQPYARASGTSFAAPLVAGAAALLLDRDPTLRPLMLIALLRGGAQRRPSGPPLLDIAGALEQRLYTLDATGIAIDPTAVVPPAPRPDADRP